MGKGEIALFKQFLLFPQCFQKACFRASLCGNGLTSINKDLYCMGLNLLHFDMTGRFFFLWVGKGPGADKLGEIEKCIDVGGILPSDI